jgi:hypothetical protein
MVLKAGAQVDLADSGGRTPLLVAAQVCFVYMLRGIYMYSFEVQ